jgi:hypothetical protein
VKIKPHSPIKSPRSHRTFNQKNYSIAKPWVIKAIIEESKNPSHQMWKNEPSAEIISYKQLIRIRFLQRHGKSDPKLLLIADCLEQCDSTNPCCSGVCPQCSRLFQRFYVRQTRRPIRNIIAPEGKELIAICIIPSSPMVRHGQLKHFSIANFQRRIKTALDAANIKSGIGGVDFSFNEDREKQWQPFICPHIYLITSTDNKEAAHRILHSIFKASAEIIRPIKLPKFQNIARRRSYSLKMIFKRRNSYLKKRKGKPTKSRNTSYDKLRADERIELFKYLYQIGLSARIIFRGIKPEVLKSKVRFRKA